MEEYYLYFDESGNLGIDGRYFVISCVVTKDPKPIYNKMKKILLKIKNKYKNIKWNRYELKANTCKPWIKEIIYRGIIGKDFEISYIVADKVWIKESLKKDKNILYNYLLSVLLDNYKNYFRNNKVNLILDNKTIKVQSLNSFSDYIKLHMNYVLQINADINVEYMDSSSKKAYNVQLADYIANAIYAYYQYNYDVYYEIIKEKVKYTELFPRRHFGKDVNNISEIAITK